MVGAEGFEPSTCWLSASCSARLSYTPSLGRRRDSNPGLLIHNQASCRLNDRPRKAGGVGPPVCPFLISQGHLRRSCHANGRRLGAGYQIRTDTFWVEARDAGPLNTNPAVKFGGQDRDRTCDIQRAKLALSRLSYSPLETRWPEREGSNLRRRDFQSRALPLSYVPVFGGEGGIRTPGALQALRFSRPSPSARLGHLSDTRYSFFIVTCLRPAKHSSIT
jgi:hypothetical protein